uniref:Uncharacterized protein n=1 Tax=Callorhinchus milii TaxID=7868 RepID=A0A4W3IE86_CALMI
ESIVDVTIPVLSSIISLSDAVSRLFSYSMHLHSSSLIVSVCLTWRRSVFLELSFFLGLPMVSFCVFVDVFVCLHDSLYLTFNRFVQIEPLQVSVIQMRG